MNPPSPRCADTWQTLPELALGVAGGEERALALEHVAGCADCRRELEKLSAIADDLLALVPEREPPAGFEARVLARMPHRDAPPRRRWLWRSRRFGFAAAALAGAAATAIVLSLSFSSDRELAAQYRAALQDAHGTFFQSAALRTAGGERVGTVFGYQGSPSWLFYVLRDDYRTGAYREQLVTRSGQSIALPPFRLAGSSWGITTPVPVRDVARVRLIRQPGGKRLEATLPVVER